MSRLIFDASTLGGTTTLSSEDAVGNFTIDVPAVTGTMLIPATVGLANQVLTSNATAAPTWAYLAGTGTVTSISGSGGTTGLTLTGTDYNFGYADPWRHVNCGQWGHRSKFVCGRRCSVRLNNYGFV